MNKKYYKNKKFQKKLNKMNFYKNKLMNKSYQMI